MEDFIIRAFDTGDIKIVIAALAVYAIIYIQRKETSKKRNDDADNTNMRITLVEHDLDSVKKSIYLFSNKLDKILDEITQIKIELTKKEDK